LDEVYSGMPLAVDGFDLEHPVWIALMDGAFFVLDSPVRRAVLAEVAKTTKTAKGDAAAPAEENVDA